MAYQQGYQHGYQTPDQAAYQAGYDAGFRAGYQAGLAAQQQATPYAQLPAQQHPPAQQHASQQQQYPPPPPQLPYRPPRPPTQQQQQQPAPSIPPRPPPPASAQQTPTSPTPPPPPTPTQQHPSQQTANQIWHPRVGTTFNYVLSHPIKLSDPSHPLTVAEVYIVDLFDTPASSVAALHAQGCKVVAYFSAGTAEEWRPDVAELLSGKGKYRGLVGAKMDGWAGERWVDVRSEGVRSVMVGRLDLARDKGFDAVDPDNVDGWENKKNGLNPKLTREDAVAYVRWLAGEAHARGMACGLKNGGEEMVGELVGDVEFVVQEQAVQLGDEEAYMPFIRAGKPVFHVEYPKGEDPEDRRMNDQKRVEGRKREKAFKMREKGWSSCIKNVCLDQWVQTD